MNKKANIDKIIDIPEARRLSQDGNKNNSKKILIFSFPLLIFILSIIGFKIQKNNLEITSKNNKSFENNDHSILGHLPYKEVSQDDLLSVNSNIKVHRDMIESLLSMQDKARRDGVYLVFLSGFRSIKLQEDIFYSLKSKRNQSASERAKVSAPPGYSEHSTGFAIDIGDAHSRNTDFEVEFENTNAFKWLKNNAAKFHFKLSFNKNNLNVDYEPWHWRYEGSIEALKIFETSNRRLTIVKDN